MLRFTHIRFLVSLKFKSCLIRLVSLILSWIYLSGKIAQFSTNSPTHLERQLLRQPQFKFILSGATIKKVKISLKGKS